ncbi:MAG TPA: YqaJ viral recombinase family protein, partial [Stellaceae bacterium]|nr:YqaJ viral recombinase family protein [Stellaceae bacterium]
MRVFQCEQYSDDWFRLRLGIPTASAFNNIMTPGGAPTKGERRIKYMYRLVCERLMKQSMEDFSGTYWTKRGERLEQEALDAFVLAQDLEVKFERTGFITSDDGRIGASPDCLIRSPQGLALGGLEIKCPSPWVQMEYLLAGLGENYAAQVQGQLLISEQEVWHLWSYHPKMPPCHVYTLRDDDYI